MSADVERVEKFLEDATKLVAGGASAQSKVIVEIKRLRTWLGKHQEEMLTDSGKQKLMSTVEAYFKFCSSIDSTFESELGETTQALISDLLKLPEGKLIRNSGGKSKALKWLDATQQSSKKSSCASVSSSSSTSAWTVADVDSKLNQLTLMSVDGDEVREDFIVSDAELLKQIKSSFDSDETVTLCIDDADRIVSSKFGDDDSKEG